MKDRYKKVDISFPLTQANIVKNVLARGDYFALDTKYDTIVVRIAKEAPEIYFIPNADHETKVRLYAKDIEASIAVMGSWGDGVVYSHTLAFSTYYTGTSTNHLRLLWSRAREYMDDD